jgi:hypothetical protein
MPRLAARRRRTRRRRLADALGLTAAQADASSAIGLKADLVVKGSAASDRLALRLRAGANKIEVDVGDNGSAAPSPRQGQRIRVQAGGAATVASMIPAAPSQRDPDAHRRAGRQRHAPGRLGAEKLNGDSGADVIDGNGRQRHRQPQAGDDP